MVIYKVLIDQYLQPKKIAPKRVPRKNLVLPAEQVYEVKRVKKAPVIDGKMDEACWPENSKISNLRSDAGMGEPRWNTSFHLLYDDKFLYIGLRAPDLTASTITEERSGDIWKEDGCEIFLDTNFNRWSYFQILANANAAFNMTYRATPGLNGQLEHLPKGCLVKGSVADGSIEMAIPFSAFNGHPEMCDPEVETPKPGTIWGANFIRNQHSKKGGAMWAQIPSKSSHFPWLYNAIKFVE